MIEVISLASVEARKKAQLEEQRKKDQCQWADTRPSLNHKLLELRSHFMNKVSASARKTMRVHSLEDLNRLKRIKRTKSLILRIFQTMKKNLRSR